MNVAEGSVAVEAAITIASEARRRSIDGRAQAEMARYAAEQAELKRQEDGPASPGSSSSPGSPGPSSPEPSPGDEGEEEIEDSKDGN